MARLDLLLNGALVAVFALMALAASLQVVSRYVFNDPIVGTEEVALTCAVWLTFLGAAVVSRDRLHIAIDLLTERLAPRGAAVLRAISSLASVAFAVLILVYGIKLTTFAHGFETSALRLPSSVVVSALPVGAAMLAWYELIASWRALRAAWGDR